MRISCFYYDSVNQKFERTNYWKMLNLEQEDYSEFMRRRSNLFRSGDGRIPMVLVMNGKHVGFRRKGSAHGGVNTHSRGDSESLTHQGNKEALASMKELEIQTGDEVIKLFIDYAETEKEVICNDRRYEIDIYFKLKNTEPTEYYEKWNGELWFEVYHTCKVDYVQAEDFAIANKTLFEFKIAQGFEFSDYISEEGYEKRISTIKKLYTNRIIEGILVHQSHDSSIVSCTWYRSSNGNMTASIGGMYFTVRKSDYGTNFGIVYDRKIKWDYNKQKFETEEDAMRVAEHFAFLLYNRGKIGK